MMRGQRSRYSSSIGSGRAGFTLVELLVVIVIIALLISLLVPAITGAVKTARNAAVSTEINSLSQALADFKNKYGDYPPSRIMLSENGAWDANSAGANSTYLSAPNEIDISRAALAQRSLSYMRKFWPRVAVSSDITNPIFGVNSKVWYDFNGNGTFETAPYILQGHECLVFFLGGIPVVDGTGKPIGVGGFAKNPSNPFLSTNAPLGSNRQPPLFEFDAGRLALDPTGSSLIPGYYDSFKTQRFYAYFSAYGGGAYDPNDVNLDNPVNPAYETDGSSVGPVALNFLVSFPVQNGPPNVATSAPPNPYASTSSKPPTGSVAWQKPQTFQILSAGDDGQYGLGGLWAGAGSSGALPLDLPNTTAGGQPESDTEIRIREKDNITNFNTSRLD